LLIFDVTTLRRVPTTWGTEVKKRLLERNIKQDDVVKTLQKLGFESFTKYTLSNLLYGNGTISRNKEIEAINNILNIPFEKIAD
jgi:hypothetical protein